MPVISGGSGGGAAFNGGTVANPTTFASGVTMQAADPTLKLTHNFATILGAQTLFISDVTAEANTGNGLSWIFGGADGNQEFTIALGSTGQFVHAFAADGSTSLAGALGTVPAAPGTATLSSGVGMLFLSSAGASVDLRTHTPVTFNPTAGAAATCAVAISPDNVTYAALWTETVPAGVALDGTIHGLSVYVPVSWYLKMTVVNATIGTTTYY